MRKKGDELLSIPQAAQELNMTRASLWRYVNAQRLPALMIAGVWLIERSDLEEFARNRRGPGRPKKADAN